MSDWDIMIYDATVLLCLVALKGLELKIDMLLPKLE